MEHNALSFESVAAFPYYGRDARVKGVGEGNVADNPALKEGERSDALCAVDDRVRDHEVSRFHFFAERANSAEGDDGAYAEGAECGDVCTSGHLVRSILVVDAVACEKSNWDCLPC